MAEAHGADSRLVAFMQYLRVVFVAIAASVISRLWTVPSAGHAAEVTCTFPGRLYAESVIPFLDLRNRPPAFPPPAGGVHPDS